MINIGIIKHIWQMFTKSVPTVYAKHVSNVCQTFTVKHLPNIVAKRLADVCFHLLANV